MIRRLLIAALDAGTLSRTVLVLSRQLDNAHLLAASEEARADRAEADHSAEQMARRRDAVERDAARERVAELEAQLEASGELAAEQPAADALPDLIDAAPPLVTPDPLRETDYQRDRADSLMRTLHATEAVVLDLRARLAAAERETKETRAQLQQTERAAGAHIVTIEALREQIAAAHRAAHAIAKPPPMCSCGHAKDRHSAFGCVEPLCLCSVRQDAIDPGPAAIPAEQIPGVAAADEPPTCAACTKPALAGSERTGEAEAVLLCSSCHLQARAEEAKREDARRYDLEYDSARNVLPRRDADDPPPHAPEQRHEDHMRPGALKMLAEEVKRAIDVIDRPYTNESDPYKGWSRLRQNAHAEMLRSKSRELAEEVIAAVERLEQRTT